MIVRSLCKKYQLLNNWEEIEKEKRNSRNYRTAGEEELRSNILYMVMKKKNMKLLQSKDREEESKALQSHVDSLQQDLRNLQQRLNDKNDEIAAMMMRSIY